MKRKILTLAVMGALFTFLNQPLLAEKKENIPSKEILSAQGAETLALPSINEINKSAQAVGVTSSIVTIEKKSYDLMKNPAKRAFEVGKTVFDISFLVLERNEAPSQGIRDIAVNALGSISLPTEFQTEFTKLKDNKSNLKKEELIKQMDNLVNMLVSLQDSKDPATRDMGMTLLAAGYFKAYYLAAQTVKEYPKPTKEQLGLFSWKALTNYFINYFTNTALDEYKNNKTIKVFLTGLNKIKPIVDKPRNEITKEDVAIIYNALNRSFK